MIIRGTLMGAPYDIVNKYQDLMDPVTPSNISSTSSTALNSISKNELEKLDKLFTALKDTGIPLEILNNINECDLHIMTNFPNSFNEYKNSYILTKDQPQCVYISPNGIPEKVDIFYFDKFLEEINKINQTGAGKIHLIADQVNDLITLNGGHSPKQSLIKQQVINVISIAENFFCELNFFSENLKTITGNIEKREVVLTESITYQNLTQKTSLSSETSSEKNLNLQEPEMPLSIEKKKTPTNSDEERMFNDWLAEKNKTSSSEESKDKHSSSEDADKSPRPYIQNSDSDSPRPK